MATNFFDPNGGNDANPGTSYANRKKTLTGITPANSDENRVLETPPVAMSVTGAFTDASRTVTLSGAVNATISDCGTAWTPSVNVTQSQNSSVQKEGSFCQNIIFASGFTTGLGAFFATGTLDLSGYQQITFWIQTTLASVAAGAIEIRLCSDIVGAVAVNTFALPALAIANQWASITIDLATNLGSAIASVAIYETSDLTAHTVVIDNICAVKAAGNQDALSLNSLITKNTTGLGTDGSYSIKSISGTTIIIDNDVSSISGSGRGYSGTTETVTLYKIEPFLTTMITGATVYSLNTAISEATPVTYTGGWSAASSMTSQTGVTFYSGQNSKANLLSLGNSADWYILDSICGSRYNNVVTTSGGTASPRIRNIEGVSCGTPFVLAGTPPPILSNLYGHNSLTDGLSTSTQFYGSNLKFNNNTSTGLTILSTAVMQLSNITCKNNGTTGLSIGGGVSYIRGYTSSGNATAGISASGATLYIYDAVMTDTVSPGTNPMYSNNHQGVVGAHTVLRTDYTFASETTIVRTAGKAWGMSPLVATRNSELPCYEVIATIYCVANKLVTVSAYPYRTNTGLSMKLVVRGRQIAGVATDVSSSLAAGSAGSYEASPLSLSFTPTQSGVVQVEMWAWGGTTYTGYFDDMAFTSV